MRATTRRIVAMPDARIEAAITHWAPRFTSQGVDPSDFALAGNLRRPHAADPAPLVLLLPGLDSAKEEFPRWEEVFLVRGLATFSLDGPGQGETGERSSIYPNYEVAVTAAIDALQGREGIDLERIGAAGVSLGGYYAPRAAAYEKRLKAVVGISGPFTFGDCWETMPEPTRETV